MADWHRIIPLTAAGIAGAAGIGALGAYSLLQTGRTPTLDNPDGDIWHGHDRHALVCGVGGVAGAVWQAGLLQWLEQHDTPLRNVPLIIGTSAGSLVAALARTTLTTHQLVTLAADGELTLNGTTITLPELENPLEHAYPGNPRVHPRDSLTQPFRAITSGRFPSIAGAIAGLIPSGQFSLEQLADTIDYLWSGHGRNNHWPTAATWIVAVDLSNGQRVTFGAPGEPNATCGQAVAASCAVPGVLEPVTIGQRRYIDGGVASFTNLDLALAAGATHITVLNPVGVNRDRVNNTLVGHAEALLRKAQTRAMHAAVDKARKTGVTVDVHVPTQLELDAMGDRLLDFTRSSDILAAIDQRRPHTPA